MPPSLISAEQAASLNDQAKNGDFAKYYTEAGVYPLTVKAVASRIAPENDRDAGRPQIILTYGDPDDRYKEFIDRITVTGSEDYVQWNLKRLAKLLERQSEMRGLNRLQRQWRVNPITAEPPLTAGELARTRSRARSRPTA